LTGASLLDLEATFCSFMFVSRRPTNTRKKGSISTSSPSLLLLKLQVFFCDAIPAFASLPAKSLNKQKGQTDQFALFSLGINFQKRALNRIFKIVINYFKILR
jgi:hypothetical protein